MEKLLAIVSLMQKTYGRRLFQRLIIYIILIIFLTIITAIMVSTLLIACLLATYYTLLSSGIEQPLAMLAVAVATLALTLMAGFLIFFSLRRLRHIPHTLLKRSPFMSGLMDMLDAFMGGFMADKKKNNSRP